MILYAIVDKESGLLVTRQNRLDELGAETKLFKNRTDAMRYIENPINKDLGPITILQNDLAWDLLEKLHNKDRWHIDCSMAEYKDAISQFKNLKVVRLDIFYD